MTKEDAAIIADVFRRRVADITKVVLAMWLLTSPTFAQTKHAAVVQKPQGQKLSQTFLKPAGRALDAAKSDLVSKEVGKPTPATDRIDEAQTVATTDGDKAFVEALRSFYFNRQVTNIVSDGKRVKIEFDLGEERFRGKGNGAFLREGTVEYRKEVADRLSQDRDVAKDNLQADDCSDTLSDMLKAQTFTGTPTSCKKEGSK